MKLYEAGRDSLNLRALDQLHTARGGLRAHAIVRAGWPAEKISASDLGSMTNIRFIRTGEKRAPRAGEWYLSGAEPEAWFAPNDLETEFHILRPATAVEIEQVKLLEQMERTIAAKRQENDELRAQIETPAPRGWNHV